MKNKLTVCSFSGGRSSALMTKILLENIEPENLIIVFANTGKEHEKTLEFVHNFELHFGCKIYWIEYENSKQGFKIVDFETASRNGEPFKSLIQKREYLPNVMTRFCTIDLKIRPIKRFIKSLGYKDWINAVGLRADEPLRIAKLNSKKDIYTSIAPLLEFNIKKQDVLDFWSAMPFDLEIKEYLGNCDCCFLKGINKIKLIEQTEPQRLDWWIEQEENIKATFRKDRPLKAVRHLLKTQPTLFQAIQEDIQCFCNVD